MVYGKMMQASVFYSTTDVKALDAGVWLQQNYPNNATVVDTEIPGFWFSAFSGKNVIAQTSATVETNDVAWSVLSLSYDIQDPAKPVSGYEAYGDTFLESYVSINGIWYRVSSFFHRRRLYLFHPKRQELRFFFLQLDTGHLL